MRSSLVQIQATLCSNSESFIDQQSTCMECRQVQSERVILQAGRLLPIGLIRLKLVHNSLVMSFSSRMYKRGYGLVMLANPCYLVTLYKHI